MRRLTSKIRRNLYRNKLCNPKFLRTMLFYIRNISLLCLINFLFLQKYLLSDSLADRRNSQKRWRIFFHFFISLLSFTDAHIKHRRFFFRCKKFPKKTGWTLKMREQNLLSLQIFAQYFWLFIGAEMLCWAKFNFVFVWKFRSNHNRSEPNDKWKWNIEVLSRANFIASAC